MAPDNINFCYASPSLTSTMRITLMVSARHYQHETIQQMDALSVWKGADKFRRTEHMHNHYPRPEIQELSWEINGVNIDHARDIIETQQKTTLVEDAAYLRELRGDQDLEMADRLMSSNGIYPVLNREAMA